MNRTRTPSSFPELLKAAKDAKQFFILAGVFSAATNLLMLVPILYMLQVYDRVISSGSYSTLAMLTILMVALMGSAGGFEWARSTLLVGASAKLDQSLRIKASKAAFRAAFAAGGDTRYAGPLNDLQGLRQFLTGNGIIAFFDTPWCPIYIAVMYMFHPWFGLSAILAVIVMISLAILNNRMTTAPLEKANELSSNAARQMNGILLNSEVVGAMGMEEAMRRRHGADLDELIIHQAKASKAAAVISNISKSFRLITQSLLLGMGALLALNQEISPGMMIAGSLLLGRALAPIDVLVGTWKGFTVARLQYSRLGMALEAAATDRESMRLPAPKGKLSIENLVLMPPLTQKIVVRGVNLELNPGDVLGVIGPSGSGKSCLARGILGIWPAAGGKVRLDGADVASWNRNELGPFIGYLPQNIELFEGTISENISRFGGIDSEKIVKAAKAAGVHDLILSLPEGYETAIGRAGGALSGGQRQRIGLARALFGDPKLLVLDEPNSNLDDQGEKALIDAIANIASKGASVVVVTHRTSTLSKVDKILCMQDGSPIHFGPRNEILKNLAAASKTKAAGSQQLS
ncbi:type I secretion system permease/ATPase [Gammaproteobacteria bacterium]|nr:type I secretion system permease/ATPase [Gammaproteobacteria bacterium]